ncbi:MAG: response regulator transcription factor [bacterium]|nr:response regulator transcription factor [bacterium]
MRRILLVEDEPSLVLTLTDRLIAEGYAVETAGDGETGLAVACEGSFDLIVLDVMLPRMNGFDVCRELRRRGLETPILMLTARGQVVDKVVGLKLGADDYLTKPFEMMELLARLEALLRRARAPIAAAAGSYAFGDVRIDFGRGEVSRDGRPVELSALEFKLLQHFIEHRKAVLSRDQLLDEVWGYEATPYTRTVDVHVASLRQKIEPQPGQPQFIVTVHGRGYKFVG